MKLRTLAGCGLVTVLLQSLSLPAHALVFEARLKASSTGAGVAGQRDTLTDLTVLERCVPDDVSKQTLRRDYRLVYNTAADRLQVVRADSGELVCDVLLFQGGNAAWSARQSERLAMIYLPGVPEPVGSALIAERASSKNDRAAITARLQFVLPADAILAGSDTRAREGAGDAEAFFSLKDLLLPDTDARVYTGLLTSGRLLEFENDGGGGEPTAPGPQPGGSPSSQDVDFIRAAAQLNLAEVQMGELILQKAQSNALRAFGQHLVSDHTTALQQLVVLASQEQISVPTTVSSSDRERLRRLASANGPAFDTLARQVAIQAHEEAITRFENALDRVQDSDIRSYARAQLPVIRAHLQTARSLPLPGEPGRGPAPSSDRPSARSPFARSPGVWF